MSDYPEQGETWEAIQGAGQVLSNDATIRMVKVGNCTIFHKDHIIGAKLFLIRDDEPLELGITKKQETDLSIKQLLVLLFRKITKSPRREPHS